MRECERRAADAAFITCLLRAVICREINIRADFARLRDIRYVRAYCFARVMRHCMTMLINARFDFACSAPRFSRCRFIRV